MVVVETVVVAVVEHHLEVGMLLEPEVVVELSYVGVKKINKIWELLH
jgi:hypothetical protein